MNKDKPKKVTSSSELMSKLSEYGKMDLKTPTDILNTSNVSISSTDIADSTASSISGENDDSSSDEEVFVPKNSRKRRIKQKSNIMNPKKKLKKL